MGKNRKGKSRSKRFSLKWIFILGVAGALLTWIGYTVVSGKRADHSVPRTKAADHLPRFIRLDNPTAQVPARRWTGDDEWKAGIQKAAEIMRQVRNSEELSTHEDIVMYDLLDHYFANPGSMMFEPMPAELVDRGIVLAYGCKSRRYQIGAWQKPPALLATSIYHELHHAAVCDGRITTYGSIIVNPTNDERCHLEAPAHAAGVRMYLALYNRGLLPAEEGVPATQMSSFDCLMLDWQALENKVFCLYLKQVYGKHVDNL